MLPSVKISNATIERSFKVEGKIDNHLTNGCCRNLVSLTLELLPGT